MFSVLRALEILPLAPPPVPRQLSEQEQQKLEEQEEDTLRELRLFLRDVTNRLAQDKRFKAFTKPVDTEEVRVFTFKESDHIVLKYHDDDEVHKSNLFLPPEPPGS